MTTSNLDRQKTEFLELANRGKGFTPITYIYSKDISSENVMTRFLSSAYANIRDISNNTIESNTSAQIANIEIYQNTIQTSDDMGHLDIKIGKGNGDINIHTYNYSTSMLSSGNIILTTYGSGNIYLTPTYSGNIDNETIGNVFINTLKFSCDANTSNNNTITIPTDLLICGSEITGNINISTFNGETNELSTGDITLTTYGSGDINLIPTMSGPNDDKNTPEIGNVYINTLQFSLATKTDSNSNITSTTNNIQTLTETGNISINTYNNENSQGTIDITTYGSGSINLMTAVSEGEVAASVNINNVEFFYSNENNDKLNICKTSNDLQISSQGMFSLTAVNNLVLDSDSSLSLGNNTETITIGGADSESIICNVGVQLKSAADSSDYICFLPQAGVSATYYWPAPDSDAYYWPNIPLVPGLSIVSMSYLTCDSNGNLSWANLTISPINLTVIEIGPYLTCEPEGLNEGTLSWETEIVPLSEEIPAGETEEVEIDIILVKGSNGEVNWHKFTAFIEGTMPPPDKVLKPLKTLNLPKINENNEIIIEEKTYKIPENLSNKLRLPQ